MKKTILLAVLAVIFSPCLMSAQQTDKSCFYFPVPLYETGFFMHQQPAGVLDLPPDTGNTLSLTVVPSQTGINITSNIPMIHILLIDVNGRIQFQSEDKMSRTSYIIAGTFAKGSVYMVQIRFSGGDLVVKRVVIP